MTLTRLPYFLSPKPVLKVYQDHKQPEYIYEQNRRQLMSSGIIKPSDSMLERPSFTTLEAQDTVKRKQVRYVKHLSNHLNCHVCSVAQMLSIPQNMDKVAHTWIIEYF